MCKRMLAALVCAGLAATASAQTPAVSVTFDEAVARALAQNPTVARAATAIARAEALLGQVRAATRPSLSARVQSVTLDTGVSFDDNDVVPKNQVTFGATASLAILDPAGWARRAQARDRIAAAEADTAVVRQQVAVATARAYLAVIAARRQVDVGERALETARAHLTYAETRFEGGVGSRLNMLRAAQAAAADEAQVENARLALRQAQEALGALLVEDGPVDASAEPSFEVPAAVDEQVWMAARTDVIAQDALVRAAARVVSDSWKDVAPFGTVSFDPQYVTPSGLFQPSRSWRLTFAVTQPIFQGGLQRAVRRERQVAHDATRLALRERQIQARAEVRVARAGVESAGRVLATAERAASQAGEVLAITTSAFEVGATTNIEVIDAQRSARDAGTAAAVAADALQRARLDLLVALGQFPR